MAGDAGTTGILILIMVLLTHGTDLNGDGIITGDGTVGVGIIGVGTIGDGIIGDGAVGEIDTIIDFTEDDMLIIVIHVTEKEQVIVQIDDIAILQPEEILLPVADEIQLAVGVIQLAVDVVLLYIETVTIVTLEDHQVQLKEEIPLPEGIPILDQEIIDHQPETGVPIQEEALQEVNLQAVEVQLDLDQEAHRQEALLQDQKAVALHLKKEEVRIQLNN